MADPFLPILYMFNNQNWFAVFRFVSSNTSETTVKEVKIEPVVVAKEIKVVRTKIIWKPCEMLAYKMNVETIGG